MHPVTDRKCMLLCHLMICQHDALELLHPYISNIKEVTVFLNTHET